MGWEKLFISSSERTFHTHDPPDVARRVVSRMTVSDGAPGGVPPGVVAGKTGPGQFNAISPFAGFDSRFEVRGDGRGGSYVTERKLAGSFMPGMGYLADKIHDAATNPQDAYFRARRRG